MRGLWEHLPPLPGALISRVAEQLSPTPAFTTTPVSTRSCPHFSSLSKWPFGQHSCASSWRQSSDTGEITYRYLISYGWYLGFCTQPSPAFTDLPFQDWAERFHFQGTNCVGRGLQDERASIIFSKTKPRSPRQILDPYRCAVKADVHADKPELLTGLPSPWGCPVLQMTSHVFWWGWAGVWEGEGRASWILMKQTFSFISSAPFWLLSQSWQMGTWPSPEQGEDSRAIRLYRLYGLKELSLNDSLGHSFSGYLPRSLSDLRSCLKGSWQVEVIRSSRAMDSWSISLANCHHHVYLWHMNYKAFGGKKVFLA